MNTLKSNLYYEKRMFSDILQVNLSVNFYLSGIYSVIHDLNPSFKSSYLEETQVGLANVVEIHW